MNYTKPMEGRRVAYADNARETRSDDAGRGETFVKNAAWTMAMLTVIGVGLLILWLGSPMMHGRRDEQWKAAFAEGERARESGDRYRALEMYIHSARMASSMDDWRGQLNAACGLQKLGKTEGPSLYGFNVIVSAMGSAERQKSAEGMKAVADAFASLGQSYASFALSRIEDDWPSSGSSSRQLVKPRTLGTEKSGC
jgi:hypothetical protein